MIKSLTSSSVQCPESIPYLADVGCINCETLFNETSKKCTQCPPKTYFNDTTFNCEVSPPNASNPKVLDKIYNEKEANPTYSTFCPIEQPYFDGAKCINC